MATDAREEEGALARQVSLVELASGHPPARKGAKARTKADDCVSRKGAAIAVAAPPPSGSQPPGATAASNTSCSSSSLLAQLAQLADESDAAEGIAAKYRR